jgi:hypothetical protein
VSKRVSRSEQTRELAKGITELPPRNGSGRQRSPDAPFPPKVGARQNRQGEYRHVSKQPAVLGMDPERRRFVDIQKAL